MKVTDRESALRTRELALMEGIFSGYSSGGCIQALLQIQDEFTKDDVVVLILTDHGSKYLGKVFNDQWMESKGFLTDVYEEMEEPLPLPAFIPSI